MMNKSQIILYIYDLLITKGYITKKETMLKANISELSFRRYLKDIREYLDVMQTGKELVYSERGERYYLVDKL